MKQYATGTKKQPRDLIVASSNGPINNKNYQAARKINSKGVLAANLSEKINDKKLEIAAGERKQFGESMTHEIEKIIGLDFEKLKIASIVQQGELNSIIKAKPKEFKELTINTNPRDATKAQGAMSNRNPICPIVHSVN